MDNKILGSYVNGDYTVTIYGDGTKIRENDLDCLTPDKPESIDLKITNRCDMNCPMCHEDSTPDGADADLSNLAFLDTLSPYTEIAIGGGNPLEHPYLVWFLQELKRKNLIANITVNQRHFIRDQSLIRYLVDNDLIHGVGVSVMKPDEDLICLLRTYPNAVVHVINGMIDPAILKPMCDKKLKLLILGYKNFRRGKAYHSQTVENLKYRMYFKLPKIIKHFAVTSFDNLAVSQLEVRRLMSNKRWDEFYMGDDGQYTMYIDAVKREFAKSSVSPERHPLTDDIKFMFNCIRGNEWID